MSEYRENNDLVEFSLPKQGYAAFDATSLKNLIIERLNDNSIFTDQNFEGSNLNAFIDIISYAYHVLLFYLNNTSNETLFSESQIYENINRIVKSIDYKPVGTQSAALTINADATSTLAAGTYTIPRYSYISIRGVSYSFKSDITFVKTTTGDENISSVSNKELLYQGNVVEYPEYISSGEPNEILTIVPDEGSLIDHFSIDVYVKEGGATGVYHQYDKVTSLFFARPTDRSVEIRLNENKRYEVKFGNDVNGKQLKQGDIVYVYYITSDGSTGEVEANATTGSAIRLFASQQYNDILQSSNIRGTGIIYMSQSEADNVLISNDEPSSKYYEGESVVDIKENAPKTFSSQYRLVSVADYETYIKTNYSNFITDVKGMNNTDYLDTHIKYYYDLGITSPSLESRILLSQVQFSTSCNFNNLYLYCVPRIEMLSSESKRANYLTTAQKELIINDVSAIKTIACDPIIMDPVYVSVDIGIRGTNETLNQSQATSTRLMIVQEDNSRVNSNDIVQKVISIFKQYFDPTSAKIGMTIDITQLGNDILSIPGVNTFYTYRIDTQGDYVEGLSLFVWNSVYTQDIIQSTQNIKLPQFKFPFFEDVELFGNKIIVARQSDAQSLLRTSTDVASPVLIDTIVTRDGATGGSSTATTSY